MQKWETILELINGAEEEERKGNNTHGAPSNPHDCAVALAYVKKRER